MGAAHAAKLKSSPASIVSIALKVGVVVYKDGDWFVAIDPTTGVASQGRSLDEALKNFDEAFTIWLQEAEPWEKERAVKSSPVASLILEHSTPSPQESS